MSLNLCHFTTFKFLPISFSATIFPIFFILLPVLPRLSFSLFCATTSLWFIKVSSYGKHSPPPHTNKARRETARVSEQFCFLKQHRSLCVQVGIWPMANFTLCSHRLQFHKESLRTHSFKCSLDIKSGHTTLALKSICLAHAPRARSMWSWPNTS